VTQLSFATLDHQNKKKRTKREVFLDEMDGVVPWVRLSALIVSDQFRGDGCRD